MTTAAPLRRMLALTLALLPAAALAQSGAAPATPPPGYVPVQSYGAPPPGAAPYTAAPPQHRLELVGLVGYHIASDINFTSGHAAIDGSMSYGASLRFAQGRGSYGELLWVYAPTNIHAVSTLYTGTADASLNIHYFQLGGSKSFRNGRLEPYLGATMGAALFSAGALRVGNTSTYYNGSDIWRFGFTLGGGLKIWLSEKIALQADARMLAPVWFSSSSIYVGTGGGGFAVSGGIPTVEGNFTGGIIIAP